MSNAVQVITSLSVSEVNEMLYEAKVTPIDAPAIQLGSGHTVFAVSAADYEDMVTIPDEALVNATAVE